MTNFRIPQHYQKGFEFFLELSNTKRDKFIEEIKKSKVGLALDELVKEISKKLQIDIHECEAIISMLRSLIGAREDAEIELEDFIDNIFFALKETDNKKLKPLPNLKQQLRQLLGSEHSFSLSLKANSLAAEREKILLDTTITTDIRPVFQNKNKKIDAAIVLHNLKIQYIEDETRKEDFFSLSSEDILKLKIQIADAENRELMIRKEIKLPFIDIK